MGTVTSQMIQVTGSTTGNTVNAYFSNGTNGLSFEINFICDPTIKSTGYPVFTGQNPTYHFRFRWASQFACPLNFCGTNADCFTCTSNSVSLSCIKTTIFLTSKKKKNFSVTGALILGAASLPPQQIAPTISTTRVIARQRNVIRLAIVQIAPTIKDFVDGVWIPATVCLLPIQRTAPIL